MQKRLEETTKVDKFNIAVDVQRFKTVMPDAYGYICEAAIVNRYTRFKDNAAELNTELQTQIAFAGEHAVPSTAIEPHLWQMVLEATN